FTFAIQGTGGANHSIATPGASPASSTASSSSPTKSATAATSTATAPSAATPTTSPPRAPTQSAAIADAFFASASNVDSLRSNPGDDLSNVPTDLLGPSLGN